MVTLTIFFFGGGGGGGRGSTVSLALGLCLMDKKRTVKNSHIRLPMKGANTLVLFCAREEPGSCHP